MQYNVHRILKRAAKIIGLPIHLIEGRQLVGDSLFHIAKKKKEGHWRNGYGVYNTVIVSRHYSNVVQVLDALGMVEATVKVHLSKRNVPMYYAHVDGPVTFRYVNEERVDD